MARVDARTATIRNRYILEHSEKVVFAAIDPNGALSRLIGEYPDLQWQVLASVGSVGGNPIMTRRIEIEINHHDRAADRRLFGLTTEGGNMLK